MTLLTNNSSLALWHDVIKHAETSCSIELDQELEAYLISLMMRYTSRPDIAQQLFAKSFLEAMQLREKQRMASLQDVGDQCLIYAGLYPRSAQKKLVKVSYFVDIGRSAYATISHTANDLYWCLAYQFIALMDVLQSIRSTNDLLPLEAYEQWNDLGSKRARRILELYSSGIPLKK